MASSFSCSSTEGINTPRSSYVMFDVKFRKLTLTLSRGTNFIISVPKDYLILYHQLLLETMDWQSKQKFTVEWPSCHQRPHSWRYWRFFIQTLPHIGSLIYYWFTRLNRDLQNDVLITSPWVLTIEGVSFPFTLGTTEDSITSLLILQTHDIKVRIETINTNKLKAIFRYVENHIDLVFELDFMIYCIKYVFQVARYPHETFCVSRSFVFSVKWISAWQYQGFPQDSKLQVLNEFII